MKFDNELLEVLNNYSNINANIVFNEGNIIRTISEGKNLMSRYETKQPFGKTFGIYDLSEFLSVLSLFEDPDIEFLEKTVQISSGNRKVEYFYSDIEMLTTQSKDIKMPSTDVSFIFTQEMMLDVKKAASVLGTKDLTIVGHPEESKIELIVSDLENKTSNIFNIFVDNIDVDEKFQAIYNIKNLEFIAGDYEVNISSKLISEFINSDKNTNYWVALDGKSSFGED
jgi:hypothetical protein